MAESNNTDNNNNFQNPGLVLVSEIYPDNIIVLPLENRSIFPGLA